MAMDYEGGETRSGDAKSRVVGPAIGLIIAGVVYILCGVVMLAIGIITALMFSNAEFKERYIEQMVRNSKLQNPGMTPQAEKEFRTGAEIGANYSAPGYGIAGGLGTVLGVVILWGAISMLTLKSSRMAMAASVSALLPCSPCCLLGLPFGIWGIMALNHPDVKRAYQQARSERF